ncbi:type I secretion system permease/ATPase [Enterobacter hormaechei]
MEQDDKKTYHNTAIIALRIIAHFHGVALNIQDVKHAYECEGSGLSQVQWLLAAKEIGLKAKAVKKTYQQLEKLTLPALVWDDNGKHFILARIDKNKYLIHDLELKKPVVLSEIEFIDRYTGIVILVTSRAAALGSLAKFDFTWFVPAIIKYRKILLEVITASIVLQLFALMTPLFFQVVMDKVLVHRGLNTLNVITVALFVIIVFEVTLGGLRTYIFAHTTSRIDVELGAKLFRHLLKLPVAWFEKRRVGDTVARLRELEQIRNFLTGQAMTSLLDLLFSFIFIAVMYFYSGWLTLVVLTSLPCYAIWSAAISPLLRSRLNDKFARSADNQSFLVESVTSIGTLKAMAVEPQMTHHWDKQLAAYVHAGFRVTKLATIGQQGIQLIQKLVMVANLWIGAQLVIAGELSVGELIAFNMLAGQVAAPVIRLAQLWQDFQQVAISIARLGDILNTPTEIPGSSLTLPEIKGAIEFENVAFRYRPDGPQILKALNLSIQSGEIIGIVGRSGSGKSTLTRLVQRLYTPEQGRVLVDGQDLALTNPSWLRRQIGVVLQDNVLLNRSIRENIALSEPGMPLEKIIHAAKIAGAHEFILGLPEGYDTQVGEQGARLSGGQRQRVAIARALVTNPRILILDEATSALDYESEKIIMNNMQKICRNRTVIIIAHRLSTVRFAHRIIAMDRGEIIEDGSHNELIIKEHGFYRYLQQLQKG